MLQIKRGKSPRVPVHFDYILMTLCMQCLQIFCILFPLKMKEKEVNLFPRQTCFTITILHYIGAVRSLHVSNTGPFIYLHCKLEM